MYLRKGNLRFAVTQDNLNQSIVIDEFVQSIDERSGGDFFGYSNVDLKGVELKSILPEEISEIMDDNIEYTVEGNDFKSVIEKIIRFKIKNNKKEVLDMNAFVERAPSEENDNLSFNMVLEKKIHLKEKIKAILSGISEVQRVEHPKAKLMNSDAYAEVLDEIFDFLYEARIPAVMLILSIDGYPSFRRRLGRNKVDKMLKEISHTLKTTFRTRDIMAYLGVGHFALTLVKTYPEEVVHPLKRLEQNLKKAGVLDSKSSINARYKSIDLGLSVADVMGQVKSKEIDYSMNLNNG